MAEAASEANVLCSSTSPDERREAIVEADDRVVYFYLCTPTSEDGAIRSCWVRNLRAAPEGVDRDGMKAGRPPLLPRSNCRHPDGAPLPEAKHLRVVWFPEGNAAALFERDELLAIVPPWSGTGGFSGYARDCIGECPVAWAFPPAESPIFARVRAAEDVWRRWDADAIWPAAQEAGVGALEKALGPRAKYYAIDGKKWPPKAMLRFDRPDAYVYATVGVSLRPQPDVGMPEDASAHRRIELACAIDRSIGEESAMKLARYMVAQTAMPWELETWLGDGHTIPCDAVAGFDAVLLVDDPPDMPKIARPKVDGNPVRLLWLVPITDAERKLAQERGSADLVRSLRGARVGAVHRARSSVV